MLSKYFSDFLSFIYFYPIHFILIIISMITTQSIANSYVEKTGQDKSKSKFAWVPLYSWIVLARITSIPYTVALVIIFSNRITVNIITYFFNINLNIGWGIFLVVFTNMISFIGALSINYKIAKAYGYSYRATILSTILNPFVWIIFLITDKNKNNT